MEDAVHKMRRSAWGWIPSIAVIAVFLAMLFVMYSDLAAVDIWRGYEGAKGDAANYIRMAHDSPAAAQNPFALRILTPGLVSLLKRTAGGVVEWDGSWRIVTILGVFGSVVLFYAFLVRVLQVDRFVATLATLMLCANHEYTTFHFENPFLVDPLANLLWMAALYLLFSRRYTWFCITIVAGFMNKETILFLAPLYPLILLAEGHSWKERRVLAAGCATVAMIVLYAAYRMLAAHVMDPEGGRLMTVGGRTVIQTIVFSISYHADLWFAYCPFHFLWIYFFIALVIIFRRDGWRNAYLIASVYLFFAVLWGRFFATDVERVVIMLAPLVFGLSAKLVSSMAGGKPAYWFVMPALAFAAMRFGWVKNPQFFIPLDIAMIWLLVRRLETRPAVP